MAQLDFCRFLDPSLSDSITTCGLAKAQQLAANPACTISGQLPETGNFDLSQVEFIGETAPPVGRVRSISFETICRVVGLRPLILETLDISLDDRTSMLMCEQMRVRVVGARLRGTLLQLRFNDLVKATFGMSQEGNERLVLTDLEKVAKTPAYFHPRAQESVCPNRSGTLATYTNPAGETIIVHNDGAVSYQDAHFHEFNRQRLDPDAMKRLLNSFRSTGFGSTGSDDAALGIPSQPSIALICARNQSVSVQGHEAALAPVIQSMENAKAVALSQTHHVLSYSERHEVTFLEWPFSKVPIEKMEAAKEASDEEQAAACRANRHPHGAYDELNQEAVPAQFLAKLPLDPFWQEYEKDLNPYVYFKTGMRVFRVQKPLTDRQHETTYNSLMVRELLDPLATLSWLARPRKVICCRQAADVTTQPKPIEPPGQETSCSVLMGVQGGLLWPAGMGIELWKLPKAGELISAEEYARHESIYRELLAASQCGPGLGIDFLEGHYLYKGVRLIQVER